MSDLRDSFRFSVWANHSRSPSTLSTSPIWRDINGHRGSFAMQVYPETPVGGLFDAPVFLHLAHDRVMYPGETEEQKKELGDKVATLFCLFLHGAACGWSVIDKDVPAKGGPRDEIDIAKRLGGLSVNDFLAKVEFDRARIREVCREDIMIFATREYRSKGALSAWTISDFLDAGAARFAYDSSCLRSVLDDVTLEKKLVGTFGASEGDPAVSLEPKLFDGQQSKNEAWMRDWVELIRQLGTANAWMVTDGEAQMSEHSSVDSRSVFVVHGRNDELREAMFSFLRALGLTPIEWDAAIRKTGHGSPYVGSVLDSVFAEGQVVLVLLSGEDEARLRSPFRKDNDPDYERELTPQARPNVLFEAGMAIGRDEEHTIIVRIGQVRPFSDIEGRHVVNFSGSSEDRHRLAMRLETAGCSVKTDGTDWLTVGSFEVAAQPPRSTEIRATPKDDFLPDHGLTHDEAEYLASIAEPQNKGVLPTGYFRDQVGREVEEYRAMVEKFIGLNLMRDDGELYRLTLEGWELAEQLKKAGQSDEG